MRTTQSALSNEGLFVVTLLLISASNAAGACTPAPIRGPNNETRYSSADVSANRDWRQPQAVCTQICLIYATCEGYVYQIHQDGSDHCWMKTAELGTVEKDFIALGGQNSSIWNVAACKTSDTYDACLGNPVMARYSNGTVINAFMSRKPAAPFSADINDCTAACLGDAACTGFSIALSAAAGFECVLFHDTIDAGNLGLWRADFVTMTYDITECRTSAVLPPPQADGSAILIPASPSSSSKSTNVAAIVGGVLGGAAFLALLVVLLCWFCYCCCVAGPPYAAVHKSSKDDLSTPDSLDMPRGLDLFYNDFDNPSQIAAKQAALQQAVADGQHSVDAALDYIVSFHGGELDGRYVLTPYTPRIEGGQAVVAFGEHRYNGTPVAIKFFEDYDVYLQEAAVYQLLCASDPVGGTFVVDMQTHEGDVLAGGLKLPSYIVMKRGLSMQEWCRCRKPPSLLGLWMLSEVCNQVAILHNHGLIHGDLKPGNMLLVQEDNAWRVIDFGCAVREGSVVYPAFTLRYAPPEVVLMFVRDKAAQPLAHRSMDVWSLGIMAFEMLSGELVFPIGASNSQMRAVLTGERPFPFEADPTLWLKIGKLRTLVQRMLSRDPAKRPPMAEIARRLDQLSATTGAVTCARTDTSRRFKTGSSLKVITQANNTE